MDSSTITLICTIIGTGIVTIGAMLGLAKHYLKNHDDHKDNINKLNNAKKKCDDNESHIKDVDKNIIEIKQDITTIKAILIQKYPQSANIFSIKNSPRTLNEEGKFIFDKIGGEEFLKKNKDFFFKNIDEMNPQTPLDVESCANLVCHTSTNNEIFNGLKNFVYNSPSIIIGEGGEKKPYDLTIGDICFILSIPLRDMYLGDHSEIK